MLIALKGPSGSGKTSLVAALDSFYHVDAFGEVSCDKMVGDAIIANGYRRVKPIKYKYPIARVVTTTTRAPRDGEKNGVDYNFVSMEKFMTLDKIDETLYAGNGYAITSDNIALAEAAGEVVIAIVDSNGIENLRKRYPDMKVCFIQSSLEVMEERMRMRGDDPPKIQQRLENARINDEVNYDDADFYVDNRGSFSDALSELITIVESLR